MMMRKFIFLLLAGLFLLQGGCIRLMGKAGYYKETPDTYTEKTVGFDTQELLDQRKGSVTL